MSRDQPTSTKPHKTPSYQLHRWLQNKPTSYELLKYEKYKCSVKICLKARKQPYSCHSRMKNTHDNRCTDCSLYYYTLERSAHCPHVGKLTQHSLLTTIRQDTNKHHQKDKKKRKSLSSRTISPGNKKKKVKHPMERAWICNKECSLPKSHRVIDYEVSKTT